MCLCVCPTNPAIFTISMAWLHGGSLERARRGADEAGVQEELSEVPKGIHGPWLPSPWPHTDTRSTLSAVACSRRPRSICRFQG